MLLSQIKELAVIKAKAARLESDIARELKAELASLPTRFGFSDTNAFIDAVSAQAGGSGGRGKVKAPRKAQGAAKRKRAKITDATRAAVKKMAGAGETGAAIAAELGISVPSVQNIKKALGLVRGKSTPPKRKAKAPAKAPAKAKANPSPKAASKPKAKRPARAAKKPAAKPAPSDKPAPAPEAPAPSV